jgi:HSP20 family protein
MIKCPGWLLTEYYLVIIEITNGKCVELRFEPPDYLDLNKFVIITSTCLSRKGVTQMDKNSKRVVVPMINVNHNDDDTGLDIRVDLAGASKESVDLDVGDKGFCIKAEAEDFRYDNCYTLAHEVKRESAKAKFDSGLLRISVPFKDSLHGHKVTVE